MTLSKFHADLAVWSAFIWRWNVRECLCQTDTGSIPAIYHNSLLHFNKLLWWQNTTSKVLFTL